MHILLENYLAEVAAHLSALPVKQRNEELREMRAHLENAVLVSRELGCSEEEAAQNIVAQFGTPPELGQSILTAWRRGVMLDRHSFWGAAICTLATLFLIRFILTPVKETYFQAHAFSDLSATRWITLGFEVVGPVLAGTITGLLFSRRVVAGVAFSASLQLVISLGYLVDWAIHQHNLFDIHGQVILPGLLTSMPFWCGILWLSASRVFTTVFAAWAGSWLRRTRGERRRLARV